ncbi:MAG: Gfo/Idh/MocA family oxidoreductase [Treponema sp.]|jgi:predicted dehydrogenase|nr:Gfo/Idh/MocA family oxidoreductase [Treponema sp.]
MLKCALIGVGAMGRGHLENYIKFTEEGFPVNLAALCDVDEDKLKDAAKAGNSAGVSGTGLPDCNLYTSIDEMLSVENDLDFADIVLPTFLHAEVSIKCMNAGLHVLCEKPMAMNSAQCEKMIEVSQKTGKKLMIAQCLRFSPEYEILKQYTDSGEFGKITGGYFFRGGGTPMRSWNNWLLKKELSNGCLLDQHIHDVDMINYLLGKPDKVSASAKNVFNGSGYDIVSANYFYDKDDVVLNAQDDWTLNGDYGFLSLYRVNFEKGSIICEGGKVTIFPHEGNKFNPKLPLYSGYYREMEYFMNAVINNTGTDIIPLHSARDTIAIAEAEIKSADLKGVPVEVR